MADRELIPSAALPDYLKAEWQVGEPQALPLVQALDTFCERLALSACLKAFDLVGATRSLNSQRLALQLRGFSTETLTETEVTALFDIQNALLSSRGTLGAVKQLASVFLPGSRLRMGRPFRKSRVGVARSIRLVETRDRNRRIFVRTCQVWDDARRAEFLRNAATLVPVPFEVIVAPPKKVSPRPERWDLGKPRSWEGRRLACPISAK